jgi:phospholipid/cholesterol/gamma-HCH transport system substrate-binding protein
LRRFLDGFAPVVDALDPFLSNLNPIVRFLEFQKETVADFLAGPAGGFSGVIEGLPGDPAPRHVLRVMTYLSTEALALWPNRLSTNRGNAYKGPFTINDADAAAGGIFPNFDCKNTDYTPTDRPQDEDIVTKDERTPSLAACWPQGTFPASKFGDFGDGRAPNVFQDP